MKHLSGKRFGNLSVLRDVGRTKEGRVMWECLCNACGRLVNMDSRRAQYGMDCGCGTTERMRIANTSHGRRYTSEYRAWCGMKVRCGYQGGKDYKKYGGRGITVCERWKAFENFYADMGPRPSSRHTLDREDNDGNYEPGNCRWATPSVQCGNRRNGRRWVIKRKEYPSIGEAMACFGVSDQTIRRWCLGSYDPRRGTYTPPKANSSGDMRYANYP